MTRDKRRSERGVVLPLALLLMVALGLVATGSMFLSNTEARVSRSYSSGNNAVAAAEAALEHGIVRLDSLSRARQDPDGVQIVDGVLGRFRYAVTARSKREQGQDLNGNGSATDVVRYDRSFGYSQATATGAPPDTSYPVKLLVAIATDTTSGASTRVQAEVAKEGWRANMNGALVLNSPLNVVLGGFFNVDGRLYNRNGALVSSSSLTPAYGNNSVSEDAARNLCKYWKPGIKLPSGGVLSLAGTVRTRGHVAFDHGLLLLTQNYDAEEPLSAFEFTPEEVLAGLPPLDLKEAKKDASEVTDWMNLEGLNYITSGSLPSQISGSGILIVHNPRYDVKKYDCLTFLTTCQIGYRLDPANQPMTLQINRDSSFRGVIIIDKLVYLNGDFDLLGSAVVLTTENISLPGLGAGSLRWSCESVRDAFHGATGYNVRLSWEQYLPDA